MVNIKDFNEQVYELLNRLRSKDPTLRYTYRKSNYGGRLEEGFWFYGNNDYFAISFWSGMDWSNRTPNIIFSYSSTGEALIEVHVSDSDKKREFVEKYLVTPLNLMADGRRYINRYGIDESRGLDFLEQFLRKSSDKESIDIIINQFGESYFKNDDNGIKSIDSQEFKRRDNKIKNYKELAKLEGEELHIPSAKPAKLKSINIKGYQDIKDATIENISPLTQWIFLTGENGAGKTTVLKAIAMTLGFKLLQKDELLNNRNFEIQATFYKGKEDFIYSRKLNRDCNKRFPLVSGLAVFGPNRLISNNDSRKKGNTLSLALKKEGLFKPLWDFEYRMLDIEDQFDAWRREGKKGKEELEKRRYFITTLLSRVVPGLYDLRFEVVEKIGGYRKKIDTKYIVRKDENSKEESKYWQELPSGTRSVFALVSEMLIRLYHYQKDIVDPSELKGVVIIDEIDLHLHPTAQRQLIIDLSEAFKNVQFIVSTHSPIPLLGAPVHSVFVKINRDNAFGIQMQRLFDIEGSISNMLPNILYTSSVFGMKDLISEANTDPSEVMTEDNLEDAMEFKRLKDKLDVKTINDTDFINKLKANLK